MGGPSASILLRERLSAGQLDHIEAAIRAVSSQVKPGDGYDYDFYACDLRPLGGSYVGDGCPRGLHLYDSNEPGSMISQLDPDTPDLLAAEIGFVTQQEVSLWSFCNRPEDHAVLGQLTLYVAELTGGLVDFSGAVLPRLPEEVSATSWKWSHVEPYFDAMARDMPGRIVSIPYETGGDSTWAFHVADAAFLRAWLAHPNFHMIK
jgi:hypothetical protein